MAHTVVKFETHETEDATHGSHLLMAHNGDSGEFTVCGLAVPDYKYQRRTTEKGGVTCKQCQDIVKFCKSVKLY